jgi:thiamine biosynthesis protein ThiI
MQAGSMCLLVKPSGELHIKSPRTRKRFLRVLKDNLRAAFVMHAPDAHVVDDGRRIAVVADDLERAAGSAARVFGIHRVVRTRVVTEPPFEELLDVVADLARPRVEGRTFAVRVSRRGGQGWHSMEAEREIGTRLRASAAGVDLEHPEVEVAVEAFGDRAFLAEAEWPGPGGLPIGTQEGCLALLSGGFDSPVAAWMLMRRGAPVDFLHFRLDCAATDHALVIIHELWRAWGAGSDPVVWVVDFQGVKDMLLKAVPSRLRQVALKQLMLEAADTVAAVASLPAIVTGDSVGQVSSQTLHHLSLIDRACNRTVLRPLAGLDKREIIDWSRRIGTHDLSARAKEVCDLADGPVAVAASGESVDRALGALPADIVAEAVARRRVMRVSEWSPGIEGELVAG